MAYDIFNCAFNITTISFLWGISHYYAVALTGLFALKYTANMLYMKSFYKEQEDYKNKVMAEMQAFAQKVRNAEQEKPLELVKQADILPFDINKNKDTPQ